MEATGYLPTRIGAEFRDGGQASAGLPPAVSGRRVIRLYELVFPELVGLGWDPAFGAMHLGFWHGATRNHREALENEDRTLARLAGIGAGDRVLDAGCGRGTSALWLAREASAEVVGVDLVPGNVARARRLAVRTSLADRVGFYRRDFHYTGFPDGSFDVVWAVESVCHAADGAGFLAEAHRLLKPGGRLVVADLLRTARPLGAEEEALLRRCLSGWAIPDLPTEGEFCGAAEEAGFSRIGLEDATAEVWPSARRLHRRARLILPAAVGLHRAGALSGERLAAIRSALLQFEALGRALWFYGVLAATKGFLTSEGEEGGVRC